MFWGKLAKSKGQNSSGQPKNLGGGSLQIKDQFHSWTTKESFRGECFAVTNQKFQTFVSMNVSQLLVLASRPAGSSS